MTDTLGKEFSNDIWHLEKFNISNSRINKAVSMRTIRFDYCDSETNKYMAKIYGKYLIGNTNLSLSTVKSKLSSVRNYLEYLDTKELTLVDVNRESVLEYYDYLESKNYKAITYNIHISENRRFSTYLELKELVEENHFYEEDRKFLPANYILKRVSQETINQLFSILDKIPDMHSLMFLIIYSTGMRVSEVCQIEIGKTLSLDDGYFIEFYNVKMKKHVTNPISKNLYKLIIAREKEMLNNTECEKKELYLFPRLKRKPYLSATFASQFNQYIEPFDITTEDGEPFVFRPHDFRHTIASEMARRNIPIEVIQTVLHHESQQMTMAYVKQSSTEKIESYHEFVNAHGLKADVSVDDTKLEWLRENINAQILPNGACSLPVKLGDCPNSNACLTCKHFLTSKNFIDVHKKQLKETEKVIEISRKNNWEHQVGTNMKVKENLLKIIESLEGDSDESRQGN